MGIPYYFYSLTQKYNNILVNSLPLHPDIYCIDFNGIIHTVAQDVIKNNTNDIDEKIITSIWEKIEYYINTIKAKKIIICADGVAPLAKIIQQRKRRYLSTFKNELDHIHSYWDTNAITPGTQFMKDLNTYINQKIRYNTSNVQIVYSGSDENGEGEHKIFDFLNNENITDTVIINGLDADLIILSLMSHRQNIYLMRENVDKFTKESVCNYLDIHVLRNAIKKELHKLLENEEYSDDDLIETYCVSCSLLGNDFIPHLLTLDLKTDGIEKILFALKKSIEKYGILISNGKINHDCLSNLFICLSKTEDVDIHTLCMKKIHKSLPSKMNLQSDYYGLRNGDNLAKFIYNNPSKWRHEYYKVLFDSNIILCSTILFYACENYLKGIYWTYSYYKKQDLDYDWYYPYSYPPTIKDIANHALANTAPVIIKNGSFIPSNIQLLIVLPKISIDLLPEHNKKYMKDICAGLYHMYPLKYNIQTFLKTHLWECSPILPLINIKYIENIISL